MTREHVEVPRRRPPRWVGFVAAIALPILATALSRMLLPHIAGTLFIFYYPVVATAAWVGGLLPGLVATLLSVALADYYIVPPYNRFLGLTAADAFRLGLFSISALVISRLSGALWYAREQAEGLADELAERGRRLEDQVQEGQALTEELEETNERLSRINDDLRESQSRGAHLFALAARLSEAATPEQVAAVTFQEGLAAVGADAGSLGMLVENVDGERFVDLIQSRGYERQAAEGHTHFPLTPGRPVSDALLRRETVLLPTREAWLARYPEAYRIVEPFGYEAFAAVPIVLGDRAVAAVMLSFRGPHEFDDQSRAYLETMARLCAQALERARSYEVEQRLRRRTATIVEAIDDGFVAFDHELRFTYVNGRAAALWGREPAELLGRRPHDLFAGSPFDALCTRALAEHRVQTMEEYVPSLHRWLEARAYPAEDGGLVVFLQDVTARRRAEDSAAFLAEASQLLASTTNYTETLANLARAAVPRLGDWCAVDVLEDPASTAWPPSVQRVAVVHQDPEKIALGARLTEEYPTDWSRESGLPMVIREGRPMFIPDVTDAMVVAGARDERHLELLRALQFHSIIGVPLLARGRVLGALTLCMTESGRRYSSEDLALAEDLARRAGVAVDNARLLRDAEAANLTKTEFLRTISHELRQPLNATVSFLQLWELGLRGPLTDEQRTDLVRIQRNQRHLMSLIEDLLSFTRLEAGRLEVERSRVSLDETLQGLEAMIAPQMAAKGVTFSYEGCDGSLAVLGDRDRIVQIGVNLLTNALRATGSGGCVRLSCDPDGGQVAVVVADTGIGIPADKLEHVFAPFTQLGRALNQPKEGAGLGLAIARGLAEAMGGTLTATSAVGVGSTFALRLPRAP